MLMMLALTSAQAGQVVSTTAAMDHAPEGFGAWNLDNVTVTVDGGTFDATTGAYTMGGSGEYVGEVDDDDGTVTARIGGKTWPVGEPPGIKVVNDDEDVKEGKPQNCLMTTSYLEGGYLDATTPDPTLCSSSFQTHKRFKVAMQPDALDKGVDLVFNVEPDGTERDYQVFQKINNYTDARLGGFVLQIGFGVGADFQTVTEAGLSAALGMSTPTEGDDAIWDPEEIATFSHGLFGYADHHFPEDGFFDDTRAGFYTELTPYETEGTVGDTLTSTTTLGSAYAQIPPETGPEEQFGPWLPSKWAPYGVFYDDDFDPDTDAILMAFWGETAADSGEFAWMHGKSEDYAVVDDKTLAEWQADHAYSVDVIEDVLNLSLNYILTVGTVDDTWPTWDGEQATFTIRMLPVEDTSGIGAPSYADTVPMWDDPEPPSDTEEPTDTEAPSDTDDTQASDTDDTDDTEDSDDPIGSDTEDTDTDDGAASCGCASGGSAMAGLLPPLLVLRAAVRRRPVG